MKTTKGSEVWVVTWSGEDGTDVYLFANARDADAKFYALCRENDVNPEIGYAADGYGYNIFPDPDDVWAGSALIGSEQVNIGITQAVVA